MTTISEYFINGQLEGFDDEILLGMWESHSEEVIRQKREMGIIEMVLQRRMQANSAKKLFSTTLSVELGPPLYDLPKLQGLGELLPPGVFEKGFAPAHEEVKQVPDKFDMRIVNSWRSYGQHIVGIIELAELPGTRKFSIKHKKGG
jgi:hypothetical protein